VFQFLGWAETRKVHEQKLRLWRRTDSNKVVEYKYKYKNDFYSAVIEGAAEALVGRL